MEYKPYVLYPDRPVGYTLKQLRIAAGWSQGRMAAKLDKHPDTIARYERDPSTIPLETAIRYCDELGINLCVIYR